MLYYTIFITLFLPFVFSQTNAGYRIRREFSLPIDGCKVSNNIDVNLGNTATAFVTAAYCQITGKKPTTIQSNREVSRLRNSTYWRRIDTVRTICAENKRSNCALTYSNPWIQPEPIVSATCVKKPNRPDLGAIMMFFFRCGSGQTNCGKDWANTHASGMFSPSPLYGFPTPNANSANWYNASNAGFWLRELQDARYAGLQFVLPNVYGKDIHDDPHIMNNINSALDIMQGGIKIALYDDTWGYPQLFSPTPSLSDVEATARKFYTEKWKRWFTGIARKNWYLVNGRPLVYFYNSGRVAPRNKGSAVVERLKTLFFADFGVRPFVVQDRGFPADRNTDILFQWDPLGEPDRISKTSGSGKKLLHVLPKFDAMGRSNPGQIARAVTDFSSSSADKDYRIIKDAELLTSALKAGAGYDIMSIGTWNDLGEGTGVGRNYDYAIKGNIISPFYFINVIRKAQCI